MQRLLRFIRSELRWQIIFPYVAVIALVMLVGMIFGTLFVTATAEERVQNLLAQVARNTTDEQVRRERNSLDFLLMVVSAPAAEGRLSMADAFASNDRAEVARSLRSYYGVAVSNISLDIDRMIAFDRNGKTYVDWLRVQAAPDAPPESIEGSDLSGLEVVKNITSGTLINGNDKFSGLIRFDPDPQAYFYTVVPIKQGSSIVGGVMIGVKVDRLLQALQKSSQASITSFYDLSGRPIGTTLLTREELEGLTMNPEIINALATNRAQSVYNVALRQRDYRLFYSPLFMANQQVGYFSVGISSDFQFQPLASNRAILLVTIAVLTLATIVLGGWIANQINQRLRDLVTTAEAVTAGNFAQRSTIRSEDEIGQLARAFNQMTEHLLRLYSASRDLNTSVQVEQVLDVTTDSLRSLVSDCEIIALIGQENGLHYQLGSQVTPLTHSLSPRIIDPKHPQLLELLQRSAGQVLSVKSEPDLEILGVESVEYQEVVFSPIFIQEQLKGLVICASRTVGAFDGAIAQTVAAITNMAASVLNNAVLFDEVQQEAGRRRAILQSIADGVVVVDRQRTIVLANPAAEQMLGLTHKQGDLLRFDELPLTPVEGVKELFGRDTNLEHYKVDNRIVRYTSAPVIVEDGSVLGEVIVLHDISDEAALATAKTNFIATISHELRSPLTVILGYSDLLLRGLVGELTKDQRELLEAVRNRVDLMTNIIRNVIIVANLEADTLQTDTEPQELWMAVDQAASALRTTYTKKGIELRIEIQKDLPPVSADREQLQLILSQLLDNARRYTPEGSVTVTAEQHNGFVHIQVSDTGMGIPDDQQPLLFTRFHRIEGNNSPERGIGLGLMITKQLVERQGGQVWASSAIGSGSTFSFSLPIADEHNNVVTDENRSNTTTR
jgi:signal transduction histidine kinase/HAMP domain-containing protein